MPINRRAFIRIATHSALWGMALSSPFSKLAWTSTRKEIKAVAFDAFPIFDPRPIFALTKSLYPEQGEALGKLWFSKIFGYSWLRTAGNQYKSFDGVIKDALTFSAKDMNIQVTEDAKMQLLAIWTKLPIWPDVMPSLKKLQQNNIKLGFLSNMAEGMLRINARNNDIEEMFDFYLSTDKAGLFKPHPDAYQIGIEAVGLPKENIAFAAFAGWDAAGASWYGYPTVWINRLGASAEELNGAPIVTGKGLTDLVDFVIGKEDNHADAH